MKSKLVSLLFFVLALIAAPAIAREPVPVIDLPNNAVATNSGKTVTAEQVKQAILTAAASKGWTVAQQPDRQLVATILVRNKHTVVVDIAYSAESYSIVYKDSINMKFGVVDGSKVIHPYYNRWTQALKEAIRIELLKL